MNIKDLLKEDSIILNGHSQSKEEVISKLVDRHYKCGHIKDKEIYHKAILARENLSSTGVGNMIAIPHAQDETVNYPSLVAMIDYEGVDFESLDQKPAKIFFMIAVPKDGGTKHLEILAQLSQILMDETIIDSLLHVKTEKEFISILSGEMKEEEKVENKNEYDIVAVTACPTGIAHTYMAAKSLEDTAKKLGIKIKVETNGASGIKNKLTDKEIKNARCVIIAADKKVEMKRFEHKAIIKVPVAKGIYEPQQLIEEAMKKEKNIVHETIVQEEVQDNKNPMRKIYTHLMNGVSKIIPFLMICGIFTTFLSNFIIVDNTPIYLSQPAMSFANLVDNLGMFSLYLSEILFCGYIADSISDHPGFVIGSISATLMKYNNLSIIELIVMGFILGYMTLGLKKLFSYLPNIIESIAPNLLIPIIGILISMAIIIIFPKITVEIDMKITNFVFHPVVGAIIGFVLGAMMSFDMGGPVNKIAYSLGILGIFLERYDIMSSVMVAGMIPPIVIGLAMFIFPQSFNDDEIKGKWKCIIKGLCFVSEEAIPYMKKDKKGIHFPCIIASGIAGALSMIFGCKQMFPHGGIFVTPLIDNSHLFLIALLASSLIGAALAMILRKTPSK